MQNAKLTLYRSPNIGYFITPKVMNTSIKIYQGVCAGFGHPLGFTKHLNAHVHTPNLKCARVRFWGR
ncbi:hypothetical protein SAMN04487969_109248 [Paenibacillus algorifonticola]|uniref:Uncharacterized protein n=1 Tax=Paenibacillus algorifonticola TaxID=684063 RepID=A0A1I2ENM6_9BACL|nr:hypothetical protein SAMN04487969_109248 [Paenibacillus algorifonticola]